LVFTAVANDSVREGLGLGFTATRKITGFAELAEKGESMILEKIGCQWRFRHVTTVERVIGFKRGTGGAAGVSYLPRHGECAFYSGLWDLRERLCRGDPVKRFHKITWLDTLALLIILYLKSI
jgi:tryptophan 2,3-dioxygenase